MTKLITGLHHCTALASDAQKNVDFYTGILGLRLVKKTVNYDAVHMYHLYYGNEVGSPATLLTFFSHPDMLPGRKGKEQVTVISFSIAQDSLDYWIKRLSRFNVLHEEPQHRFDETYVYFEDHDGLGLELVANDKDERIGFTYGNIPQEFAIKGFFGSTLSLECYEKTAELLTDQMDHTLIAKHANRFRYSVSNQPGDFVDILSVPDSLRGQAGFGTTHHLAFATSSDATELQARAKLVKFGLHPTSVIDRVYFHSIYFREPGGVLFEIATIAPGFTIDETVEHLGNSLKLPAWEEKNRKNLEMKLPAIQVHTERYI